jgi:hypothetical protein
MESEHFGPSRRRRHLRAADAGQRMTRGLAAFSIACSIFLVAGPASAWRTVVNDRFTRAGRPPAHWSLYDGPYGSGAHNCARPSHDYVSGGVLHLLMKYRTSGDCGAGWYTGGMMLSKAYQSIDQRITLRWRVAYRGVHAHRVIPMRWPSNGSWPEGGEEDYCEATSLSQCKTFLHYGTDNSQESHGYRVDLTRWHTWRFSRRRHVVRVYRDRMTTPIWVYRGSSTTLPDTLKRVVLQQECRFAGCPTRTTGSEDIRIDWIRVENP